MNLEVEQLRAALAKKLPSLCLVVGDEPVLMLEALEDFRAAAAAAGYPPRELTVVDSGTEWQDLCSHLGTGSMFEERHFVEIMMLPGMPAGLAKKTNSGLQALLDTVAAEDAMLISAPAMPRGQPAWIKMVGERGLIVQTKRMKRREEQQWVRRQLKRRGIGLSRQEEDLLIERTEGNPLAARMEIERLALLVASAGESGADSELQIEDSGQIDVFQLAEACLSGDQARALRVLGILKSSGPETGIAIFGVLGRYVLIVQRVLWRQQAGMSQAQALDSEKKLWTRDRRGIENLLRRLSASDITGIGLRMNSLDAQLKGRGGDDAWRDLTSLVLALCGIFPFRKPR